MSQKRLRIPDEYVRLTETEVPVTQTRTFQRLFHLKQLGLAYMVYPSATHTRGMHSYQCVGEAHKLLEALGVERSEMADVRMAALLHDIGHVPFSHTLEDEHAILPKHDRAARLEMVLQNLRNELQRSPAAVTSIDRAVPILYAVAGIDDHPPDWRSDLVGNTICADLLAYISADPKWTGIKKRPGYYPIYDYLVREQNRLCIKLTKGGLRTDIVSAITDLLDMRYALTERVIFHHAKCVASAMLARAARLCGLSEDSKLATMGDERFLDYLEELAASRGSSGASALLSGLRARRLYRRVFKLGRGGREGWDEGRGSDDFCTRWRNGTRVEELLCGIEDQHDLPRGCLALWCPDGKAGMKLARTQVVWETAAGLEGPEELRSEKVRDQFPHVHKRVKNFEDQYLDLWTFWIAIDRAFEDRAADVVRSLEDRLEVKCDPVFFRTYLTELPGFTARYEAGQAVMKTLNKLQPRVVTSVSGQAASDGKAHLDEASILSAIKDAAEAGQTPMQGDLGLDEPETK